MLTERKEGGKEEEKRWNKNHNQNRRANIFCVYSVCMFVVCRSIFHHHQSYFSMFLHEIAFFSVVVQYVIQHCLTANSWILKLNWINFHICNMFNTPNGHNSTVSFIWGYYFCCCCCCWWWFWCSFLVAVFSVKMYALVSFTCFAWCEICFFGGSLFR